MLQSIHEKLYNNKDAIVTVTTGQVSIHRLHVEVDNVVHNVAFLNLITNNMFCSRGNVGEPIRVGGSTMEVEGHYNITSNVIWYESVVIHGIIKEEP